MKINKISSFQTYGSKTQSNKKIVTTSQQNNSQLMSLNKNYLAFCAGYSINLSEAYANLKPEEYPKDIQKSTEEVLNYGNPLKQTLYDIHFKKYRGILDCYSLDELKKQYPEFENVTSAYEVDSKKGIIKDFSNGESEIFSQEEDLTLQLVKLYWGRGFSLTDLEKYAQENSKENKATSLYYTMQKLNIPLMDRHYAQVLKLSNKEYNKKYTEALSIKRKEAHEAKLQKAQGEAVIIPRGKLSKAHKEHISASLKEHYRNHPEAISKMSERQKEFYEENPEQKERMQKVMLFAWHKTQEGKSLTNYLIKFFKKMNVEPIEDFSFMQKKATQKQQQALSDFWAKNPWAKEKMSIAVQKGWEHVKDEEALAKLMDDKSVEGVKIAFNTIPKKLAEKIQKWAKEQGQEIPNVKIGRSILYTEDKKLSDSAIDLLKKSNALVDRYCQAFPQESDMSTTALHMALVKFIDEIETNSPNLPLSLKNPLKREIFRLKMNIYQNETQKIYWESNGRKIPKANMDNLDLIQFLIEIMKEALDTNCIDVAVYIDRMHNECYDILDSGFRNALKS